MNNEPQKVETEKNAATEQVPSPPRPESGSWTLIKPYIWILALEVAYLFFSATTPSDTSSINLGLSDFQLRLIQFTVTMPLLLSWIMGVVGYNQILVYAKITRHQEQKKAFRHIGIGILILVCGSLAPAFVGVLRTRFGANMPQLTPATTIFSNYLYIFLPLLGLWFILSSIRSLSQAVKAPPPSFGKIVMSLVIVSVVSALNTWLVFTNPSRMTAQLPGTGATYYLPDMAIILTILVPATLTWLVGVFGVVYLLNYRQYALGAIFKSAITAITWGLSFVVISTAFLQLFLALGTGRLLAIGTSKLLGIVYIFIVFQALGYILIILSSRRFILVEKILSKYID